MAEEFTTTLSERSPRYQGWLQVHGINTVALKHPLPHLASAPGIEAALFYEMDLAALTDGQRAKLIVYLAQKFGVPEQEVADGLDEIGCPILAEDVTVTVHNPLKWL